MHTFFVMSEIKSDVLNQLELPKLTYVKKKKKN